MLVSDVMTTDVVTVPIDGSLRDVVGTMLDHDVGSVIVVKYGDPAGILTATDVLTAAYRAHEPFEAVPIEGAMSHPLVSVSPDATVRAAVERMGSAGVKRLAVTEGIDLVGIVTQSDVVRNHSALLREAIHHEERRHSRRDVD